MDPIREQIDVMTRRHFFGRTGVEPGHRRAGQPAGRERPGARRRRPATRPAA